MWTKLFIQKSTIKQACIMLRQIKNFILRNIIISVIMGILLIAFVGLAYFLIRARALAVESNCESNCKGIVVNSLDYEELKKHLPPAHVDGADGVRMHSWRAVVTADCGVKPSYTFPYDFCEPWNGPNNSKLRYNRNNHLYACPSTPAAERNSGLTNYFVVEGTTTAFPGTNTVSLNTQYVRGRSDTILIVEAHGLGIEWLEPRDLDYNTMSFLLNDTKSPSISSPHPHGPHACMADGSIRSLRDVSPGVLKAMMNVAPSPGDSED
jgi:hypothetical protein